MNFDPSELNMTVTDADASVLSFMLENKHIIPSRGVSLKNIKVEAEGKFLADVTVYKTVTKFKEDGYIQEGVKCGRAKTYYITEKGIGLYNYLFGMSPRRREALTSCIISVTGCFNEDAEIDYEAVVNEVLNSQKTK